MQKRRRWVIPLLVAPTLTLIAAALLHQPAAATKGGAPQCPLDCGVKLERAPWEYSGQKVKAVCIKAGTERIGFDHNGSDGCYTVTGLGTTSVTVTGGGTSRDCKDISNVVFYFEDCGGLPG